MRRTNEVSPSCRTVDLVSYEQVSIPDEILAAINTPTVILKPNISTRSPDSYTHPAVVRALAEALRRRGAEVVIGEGMHLAHFGQAVLKSTGYDALLAGPTVEVEWLCAHLLGVERTPVPQALRQWEPEPALDDLAPAGRLRPVDVRGPSTYARSLWGRLPAWTNVDYWASVILASVFISRAWSRVRIDRSRCTSCRTCVAHCPSGAISHELAIDGNLCTRCLSCVENCPQLAISPQFGRLMRLLNRVGG